MALREGSNQAGFSNILMSYLYDETKVIKFSSNTKGQNSS